MTTVDGAPPVRRNWALNASLLRGAAVVCLLALSLKHKEIGFEAIRPLHSSVIVVVAIVGAWLAAFSLPARLHWRPVVMLLYLLTGYVFISNSLTGGERGFKDGAYVVANTLGIFWTVAALYRTLGANQMVAEARLIVLILGTVATVVAVITWMWPGLGVGVFAPSPSYPNRAHGLLGDPSSYGGLAGLVVLLAAYRSTRDVPIPPTVSRLDLSGITLMTLGLLGVLAAGSRMALAGLAVGIATLLVVRRCNWKPVGIASVLAVVLFLALLSAKANLFSSGIEEGTELTNVTETRIIRDSFRIEESATTERLSLVSDGIDLLMRMKPAEVLLGCGHNCLAEAPGETRSTHVGYLDLGLTYGIPFVAIMIGLLLGSACALRFESYFSLHLALLGYSCVFTLFLTWPFQPFFNYPFLVMIFVIAAAATATPDKSTSTTSTLANLFRMRRT